MGLFSSKSTSTTSATNNNFDQKMQLESGAIGATASGGGMVNINNLDGGAIDGALKFGNAAMDGALKFGNATSDSAFKFGNAALDANLLLTDGALQFAGARSDSAFKLVNATVDSSLKAIEASALASAASSARIADGAFRLSNAATDSAFRFGDSTVSQAFDFSQMITQGAANELAASGTRSNALAVSAMASVKDAYANTNETLADAYATSKAGEQKMLAFGVVGLIAFVAIKVLGK